MIYVVWLRSRSCGILSPTYSRLKFMKANRLNIYMFYLTNAINNCGVGINVCMLNIVLMLALCAIFLTCQVCIDYNVIFEEEKLYISSSSLPLPLLLLTPAMHHIRYT